jgi:hypothetical protein
MASFKKQPIHKFSRVKSDLAELQKWWPAYIKDDGLLGITVDPVLFKTNFGTQSGEIADEATVAGIRVEAIEDDGSDLSGTEPTIVISGSGTFSPKCTINHSDGTSTVIMLIAPSLGVEGFDTEAAHNAGTIPIEVIHQDVNRDATRSTVDIKEYIENMAGNGFRHGPYPVFMTVQELVELIDTYRHINPTGNAGMEDSDKKAWMPHGIANGPLLPWQDFSADNRVTSSNLPATGKYRATVFMPMMLDNNQLHLNQGVSQGGIEFGNIADVNRGTLYSDGLRGFAKSGISRPPRENSLWKTYMYSGDHERNLNWARDSQGKGAVWFSQDSSEAPAPKYRMAQALACFLKDGTYALNNGVIIPYSYDSRRTLGGVNTDTMYLKWNGGAGHGDASTTADLMRERPAGIYPLFDFVQGPITPRAQGSNWTHAVLADHTPVTTTPMRFEVPPNPSRRSVAQIGVKDWYGGVGVPDQEKVHSKCLVIKVPTDLITDTYTGADVQSYLGTEGFPVVGQPILIEGVTGVLGSDTDMRKGNGKIWPTRYDSRRSHVDGTPTTQVMDCNGWWLVSRIVDTSDPQDGNYLEIHCYLHPNLLPATALYDTTGATWCSGRVGGPEIGQQTYFFEKVNGSMSPQATETDMASNLPDVRETRNPVFDTILGKTRFQLPDGKRASVRIGTGYQAGMSQGDSNVPKASSRNDTYPSRITIAERELKDQLNQFAGNRPVPRSISIQTLGATPSEDIPSAPPVITSGDGSLRVPPPLGHDLCVRYNSIGKPPVVVPASGFFGSNHPLEVKNLDNSLWRVRSDLDPDDGHASVTGRGGPDKWAWRGVSTPLWSYIESGTGTHGWDFTKPAGWLYGRNRPIPTHERIGTRLAMSPSLSPTAVTSDWSAPAGHEITDMGRSEVGCSPIHLDMTMVANIPSTSDRMVIIDFDMNEADPILGRHHMIQQTTNFDGGFGFRPLWDGVDAAGVYRKDSLTDVSGGSVTLDPSTVATYDDFIIAASALDVVAGDNVNFAGLPFDTQEALAGDFASADLSQPPYPIQTTNNRPAIWFMGSAPHWTSDQWVGNQAFNLPSTGGFGRMGTGFGQGPSFSYSGGTNTVRSIFTSGGMTVVVNGTVAGTDVSANSAVWGLQFRSCATFALTDRRPFWLKSGGSNDLVPAEYTHLSTEEPLIYGRRASTTFTNARHSSDRQFLGTSSLTITAGSEPATRPTADITDTTDYMPKEYPAAMNSLKDGASRMTRPDNPSLNTTNSDFSIDELTLRHLPTPPMLPFTVDTLKQVVPVGTPDLARFSTLIIEADNIDTDKGMNVTVSLCEPVTSLTIAQSGGAVITGFDNLDPEFLGGVGTVDLSSLPDSAKANGFVIRFNFFVPSTEQPELHPIDWGAVPIIRNYSVFYDYRPTANASVIGNTYDGSTANTAGTTVPQPFTTKVGHIISLRLAGQTTDPDRTIEQLKVDFGDGSDSGWLSVLTPAASVTYDISHVFSSKPASHYDIKVYSKDDNGNESIITGGNYPILRATIVAAEPVAVLKAVPSMVRAGQALRLDGSASYSIDTTAAITAYNWTFGDGSSPVTGSSEYQDHTYAVAGEFMATLTVTDTVPSTSPVAKAVVKVLPATLVVPLTLSTMPSSFRRSRTSRMTRTPVLDAVYPEITDTGQRGDEFTLTGMFLKGTQDTDIAFMEELMLSGALVEFEYQAVNFVGTADSKTFTGRLVAFDYNRQGGEVDRTPYTATLVREAGLGA